MPSEAPDKSVLSFRPFDKLRVNRALLGPESSVLNKLGTGLTAGQFILSLSKGRCDESKSISQSHRKRS
jgi:hypothetical protein